MSDDQVIVIADDIIIIKYPPKTSQCFVSSLSTVITPLVFIIKQHTLGYVQSDTERRNVYEHNQRWHRNSAGNPGI